MTLGFFDGVHLGHLSLLKRLSELSKETGLPSVALTFDVRPSGRSVKLLTSLEERIGLLSSALLDTVVVQSFTPGFASLDPFAFLRDVVRGKLRAKVVLAGYDCRFGKDRSGNIGTLKAFSSELDYFCEEEEPFLLDGRIVSSTLCRELLEKGELAKLQEFLGRPWSLRGPVKAGLKIGRELGFPTANLGLEGLLTPPAGVYSARYDLEGKSGRALLYIGTRPTFQGKEKVAEAFLMDFSGDIYGRDLRITPEKLMGGEKRFESPEELKAAIEGYVRAAGK
ncbi:riboflavin biosynthesis protein RibF [bacterium]|nr:riboflavin biosynthesis protein RibF [bacterium]